MAKIFSPLGLFTRRSKENRGMHCYNLHSLVNMAEIGGTVVKVACIDRRFRKERRPNIFPKNYRSGKTKRMSSRAILLEVLGREGQNSETLYDIECIPETSPAKYELLNSYPFTRMP